MSTIITALLAIVIFLTVILVHEFGHFAAAKVSGIKVDEFSIGMGPQIVSHQGQETKYALRLLPLGGYVSMEASDESDPNSLVNASIAKKIFVIAAGPMMNFILALLLFFLIAIMLGKPTTQIESIVPGSAAEAQLREGDIVVAIDGKDVYEWKDVQNFISQAGDELEIIVIRGENKESFNLSLGKDGKLGISPNREFSLTYAIGASFAIFFAVITSLFRFIGGLFTGGFDIGDLSGPVGIVNAIGGASQMGFSYLLFFVAYISTNVGFLNLLPLPALDGSKLWLLVFEGITGKSLDIRIQAIINLAGFVLLMMLIIIVTINDVMKLR